MQARYMQSYGRNMWRKIKCEKNVRVVFLRSIKNIFREFETNFEAGFQPTLLLHACAYEKNIFLLRFSLTFFTVNFRE